MAPRTSAPGAAASSLEMLQQAATIALKTKGVPLFDLKALVPDIDRAVLDDSVKSHTPRALPAATRELQKDSGYIHELDKFLSNFNPPKNYPKEYYDKIVSFSSRIALDSTRLDDDSKNTTPSTDELEWARMEMDSVKTEAGRLRGILPTQTRWPIPPTQEKDERVPSDPNDTKALEARDITYGRPGGAPQITQNAKE
jgi:hypothetical protein